MTLYKGNLPGTAFYRGSSAVSKLYIGSTQVWPNPYTPPSLGSGTLFTNTTNFTTNTWASAFTAGSTKALIMLVARTSVASVITMTVTYQGVSATQRVFKSEDGAAGQAIGWIGTLTGLTNGAAGDIVVTFSGQCGNVCGRIVNLNNWSGSVGNGQVTTYHGTTKASQTSSLVVTQTGSLLVGLGGGVSGLLDPFGASGWTKDGEVDCGSSDSTDTAAAFWHKTAGNSGVTESLVSASNKNYTDLVSGCLELV